MIERRRATIIGTIAAAHFLLTAVMLFVVGASFMAQFDSGEAAGFSGILLNSTFRILCLPLVTVFQLFRIAGTGPWGWLLFLANSALWGWTGWRVIRHSRIRRSAERPAG